MSTTRTTFTITVLGATWLLAAGALAWREMGGRENAEREAKTISAKRVDATETIRRLHAKIAEMERERSELELSLRQLPPPTDNPTDAASAPEPVATVPATTRGFLLESLKAWQRNLDRPEVQRLSLEWGRRRAAIIYAPFFRERGFSPEKIDAFQENLLRYDEQQMDLLAVMRTHGLNLRTAEMAKLLTEAEAEYQAAQRNLLGDDYPFFESFERNTPIRELVAGTVAAAALAGSPLTRQQSDQLLDLLVKENAETAVGRKPLARAVNWEVVDPRAKTILSETQWRIFETAGTTGSFNGKAWSRLQAAMSRALQSETEASPGK